METLPKNYTLLMEIERVLSEFLKSSGTPVEIRSTELYEVISKNSLLKSEFPANKGFNQFLREQHDNGIMPSFISYRVDTTNKRFYQWHFRRKPSVAKPNPINNETIEGTFNYYRNSKTNIAADGIKLNSNQEVFIYERLKKCSHLLIKIEYPVSVCGETKFVDFIIQNLLNRREFLWEHFGMTNSEHYKSKMTEKIEWYKNNGFELIENGGNLIYTYYSNDHEFQKDVDRHIDHITAAKM